jgi:large subunit ribosomal protein L2
MIQFNLEKKLSFVQLPTKKTFWVSWYCVGTSGRASNIESNKQFLTKAGINRHKNIRPTVRGVAMNPVDHPHGGRCKTNSPEVTPWSRIAKFNN